MAVSQPQTTTEQPVAVQPAATEPKLYSPASLEAAMKSGEIDVKSIPPDRYESALNDLLEPQYRPNKEPAPAATATEVPVAAPAQAPAQTEQQPQPADVSRETPNFKTFGELLKHAKDEVGEEFENAYDLIRKLKNKKEHLNKNQTALERWKGDATKNKAERDALEAQMNQLKAQNKAREDAAKQRPTSQPVAKPASEAPEIPEIPAPDELADEKEWRDYYRKVADRDRKLIETKFSTQFESLKKQQEDSEKRWQDRLVAEQRRIKEENDKRLAEEAAQKVFENTVTAADKFIQKRKELNYGKPTKQMNDEYSQFLSQVNYIKETNPRYNGRDLAADYFNGVPDAVQAIGEYAIEPPNGAKQFALVIELERIAREHNLLVNPQRDSTGRVLGGEPDFDAAYAIKKARDGADVDEINQAHARGAQQALNVVQNRVASNIVAPALSASETVQGEEQKVTGESVIEKMQQLQVRMSTMNHEQAQQARRKLEALAAKAGLELQVNQTT